MKKCKVLAVAMALSMMVANALTCFAAETPEIDWEDLSRRTQAPVEILKDSYQKMDYESFMAGIEGIEDSLSKVETSESSENGDVGIMPYQMTEYNWGRMLDNSRTGSIWITKDYTSYMYNHGHAAIVNEVGYDNGTLYVKTVEHRGPKGGYTYSTMFNTMFSNHWRECNTMRVYDVANTTAMYNAGKYAYNNLTGKTYNFIASKGADEVNCATLVYKAYRSQGILLENPASATVIPKDIVNDSDVILRANSEWAGGEHTW